MISDGYLGLGQAVQTASLPERALVIADARTVPDQLDPVAVMLGG